MGIEKSGTMEELSQIIDEEDPFSAEFDCLLPGN
jgi:hypothetical protein